MDTAPGQRRCSPIHILYITWVLMLTAGSCSAARFGLGGLDPFVRSAGSGSRSSRGTERTLLTLASPSVAFAPPSVNDILAQKLSVYAKSLPSPRTALQDTLAFLYTEVLTLKRRLDLDVPELEARTNTFGEADRLFGNFTYLVTHGKALSVADQLQAVLGVVRDFNPLKYARIRTAYPVMRRAVAAYVVQLYVGGHRFTQAEEAIIDQIAERMHKLHRLGAQSKRITEFFHVSKSGGTTLCQLGELNGCATESFSTKRNCLVSYFKDLPRWTAPGAIPELAAATGQKEPWCAKWGKEKTRIWTCKRRRQLLTKIKWTFYANEHIMHDHNQTWTKAHPCREFLNVVVFREPKERIESHMQNVIKEYERQYNETFLQYFNPSNATQWRALAPPVVDNYYVRSLLGNEIYNSQIGTLGQQHLEVAKMVTLQFEVVLTLKDIELNQDLFHLGMGWSHDLTDLHARKAETYYTPKLSPEVNDMVNGNVLDTELYEFALRLQVLDAIMFGVVQQRLEGSFWTQAGNPRLRMCGYTGAFRTMIIDAKAAAVAAQIAMNETIVRHVGTEGGVEGQEEEGQEVDRRALAARTRLQASRAARGVGSAARLRY